MSVTEIIKLVTGGGCGGILLLLTIIQVAPVKVNPWSFIAKHIGKALTGELEEKVDRLADDVKTIKLENERREADMRRVRILEFNNEIVRKIGHRKEHFEQILGDVDYYEKYCNSHLDYKNNIANDAINRIKRTYKRCGDENSFL